MRLVSRTRLLPAFVAVGLALPATAAAQSTGGASAPPPQPAADVALSPRRRRYLGREARLIGHRRPQRPRPRPARAALRRGRAGAGARRRAPRRPQGPLRASAGARTVLGHAADPRALQRRRSATRHERLARGLREGLQAGHGDLVRPRLLRQHDRLRPGADEGARRRRPQDAALRDDGRGLLRAAAASSCRSSTAARTPRA